MSDFDKSSALPVEETDEDLRRANVLLDKADALLMRHKSIEENREPFVLDRGDHLPILTDIVTDLARAFSSDQEVEEEVVWMEEGTEKKDDFSVPVAGIVPDSAVLAEMLIQLDTEIAREIEAWVMHELPQILEKELQAFSERMQVRMWDQIRATLLSNLSDKIAERLDQLK